MVRGNKTEMFAIPAYMICVNLQETLSISVIKKQCKSKKLTVPSISYQEKRFNFENNSYCDFEYNAN